MRLRTIGLPFLTLAILVLSGCVSSPAAAPSTSTATNPSTAPAATAGSEAPASPGASAFPLGSFNADPALAAQLPSQLHGATLQKLSFKGSDFLQFGGTDENNELRKFFDALGTDPQNLSIALAADFSGQVGAQLFAIRVAGTDAPRVMTEFVNSTKASTPKLQVTQATVGGKSVTTMTDAEDEQGPIYVYAHGDVVFGVQTRDSALAEEALRALP